MSVFKVSAGHPGTTDPALVEADERHFAAVADTIEAQRAALTARRDSLRLDSAGRGRRALDRDLEIHRVSARLRLLNRFGLDVCLGRMDFGAGTEPVYLGRVGLTDRTGRQLLVDWRTPAAESFFAATQARPFGLAARRRYRWSGGRIVDFWDEVFDLTAVTGHVTPDDQSAFLAGLGASRSDRMRDVLATLAADQDAIIRARSQGVLVVDGGPGTGKTVVALHRAAYLCYADQSLGPGRGGVLVVGPHPQYLAYVADVLPSLGEAEVRTCTLAELVAEGATAIDEPDSRVAALKSAARMVAAVEPAVALYEEPPREAVAIETPWVELVVRSDDWLEAFEAVDPGTPHNEARDQVWQALVDILLDQAEGAADPGDLPEADVLRRAVQADPELRARFSRAWPILDHAELMADLWAVPAYLRRCAPWLTPDQVRLLRRPEGTPWTTADLPLLDAMRRRLGDPEASARSRRGRASEADDRAYMDEVVHELLVADDDPESGLGLLNRASIRDSLVHEVETDEGDPLAGPFAHVIVDEAQELTAAEWQLLIRRCPSRSFTVVGDRAQARHGFTEPWQQRLQQVGFDTIEVATLSINYRTPAEVMTVAEPVIRAVLPDLVVPTSIRRSGIPVRRVPADQRDVIVETWLAAHDDGIACVIGDPTYVARDRVSSLSPTHAKGLEFDLVVLVEAGFGDGVEGAVDRYVAMTRTTRELVLVTAG